MNVIVELAMFPMDKGISVSPYVRRVLDVIKKSGVTHSTAPMGTCLEGSWKEVMAVVDQCYEELAKDCDRIYMTIKCDCRRNREQGMKSKLKSVGK